MDLGSFLPHSPTKLMAVRLEERTECTLEFKNWAPQAPCTGLTSRKRVDNIMLFPHFSGLSRNSQVMISRNSKSFESFVEQQRQEGLEEIRAAIFVGLASPENTKYHHDHTWWDHMKICENILIHMNIYILFPGG